MLKVGDRIELSPYVDDWMRGDRFGSVLSIHKPSHTLVVLMELSGRKLHVHFNQIGRINSTFVEYRFDAGWVKTKVE